MIYISCITLITAGRNKVKERDEQTHININNLSVIETGTVNPVLDNLIISEYYSC